MIERIDRIEGRQETGPITLDPTRENKIHRAKEALRESRAKRAALEQGERSKAHEGYCAEPIDRLRSELTQLDSDWRELEIEQLAARESLNARRRETDGRLSELLRPLSDSETSQERLASIERVTV